MAIKNFNAQFVEMTKLVGKMTESDFLNVIMNWTTGVLSRTQLKYENNISGINTTYDGLMAAKYVSNLEGILTCERQALTESLKNKLMHLSFGLIRMDRFLNALQTVKDAMMKESRKVIKKYYPEIVMSPVGSKAQEQR